MKYTMRKLHFLSVSIIAALMCFSGMTLADDIQLTLSDLNGAYARKNIARISVHDPSIFLDTLTSKTNTYYYMIGSHLGMGRFIVTANGTTMGNMVNVSGVSENSNTFFKNLSGANVN